MAAALPLPVTPLSDDFGDFGARNDSAAFASPQVELCREYRFEAAHRLPKVPPGHRCARLHGHSYKLEICISGATDAESGWLLDFYDLDRAVQPIVDALDHQMLNDLEGLENPTCERLCSWIWQRLAPGLLQLDSITVWETLDSRCTYRGPGRARAAAREGAHGR